MSSNGDGSKYVSPNKSSNQVARSVSEASPSPLKSRRSQHHHHHHHHHPHIHRREKEEKSSQSTLQKALSPSEELSRSEGVSSSESRNESRRHSIFSSTVDGFDLSRSSERRPLREGELEAEKEKSATMATELRNALTDVNAVADHTTRHLDATYYSVLEKLGDLHRTIGSLKELAAMTRQLNEDFKTEGEELVEESRAQLEGFEEFEAQEQKIRALEKRVKEGRNTIGTLSRRVDIVRKRVKGWEKAEQEWQDKTRKRLKMMWILMSICATILLSIVILAYIPTGEQGHGAARFNSFNTTALGELEKAKNETKNMLKPPLEILESSTGSEVNKEAGKPAEDPRLEIFDEL
ncbi:95c036b6-d9b7-43cf-a26e-4da34b3b41d1 [Sclerotinia trifoliorum]|uniref:95c036b6-d9b7-43cf-a26e-4da34b3b41d1 n=1 Tax=Sclerotinia trifoliorum TaxID=28548 RepID=A0A8H2ZLP5_9HELO|nr:95c036b6-d9b7-43cf-a26e-4da34b3b41d1 [Sclerotinia trifoliorum]